MSTAGILVLILFLATFTEWIVERIFGSFLQGKWMVYISAAIGIGLCFGFSVDALSLIGAEASYPHWLGVLVTGAIVGSGADAIHKFFAPSEK